MKECHEAVRRLKLPSANRRPHQIHPQLGCKGPIWPTDLVCQHVEPASRYLHCLLTVCDSLLVTTSGRVGCAPLLRLYRGGGWGPFACQVPRGQVCSDYGTPAWSPFRNSAPADREVWGDIIQPRVVPRVQHPFHLSLEAPEVCGLPLPPRLSGVRIEKTQWKNVFLHTVLRSDSLLSSHALPITRPLWSIHCPPLPGLFSAVSLVLEVCPIW